MPSLRPEMKLGLSIVVLVAALVVWAVSALAERARAELVESKRAAASMIVRVFASSLAAPLDFGDTDDVRSKLQDLGSNDQVSYAVVWRADESTALAEFGPKQPAPATGGAYSRIAGETLEFVEEVNSPAAHRVGKVLVGFTLQPELTRYASARNRILIGGSLLALLFCGGLATLFFSRGRGKPASSRRPSPREGVPPRTLPSGFSQPPNVEHTKLNPGDLLGPYQLLACAGLGGMGRIWCARQCGVKFQRLVAIKTSVHTNYQPAEQRRAFMDEARIGSLLRHPNVCGVHELGEQDGLLYQVMDWCDGASLRQVLDGAPGGVIEPALAVRIVAKVAAGLHAAHELEDDVGAPMNVVHRDVSPENILLSVSGQVTVTDFGVAKAHGQLHRPTETGEVKGKISYMAPEQVTGQRVDRRADIFALGCVLYEATTGSSPFTGEGALSTLYRLMSKPVPSPLTKIADYPEDLAAIVLRALAKDPGDRHETAEQFAVELETWLGTHAGLVREQAIAGLLQQSCGALISEKQHRIDQALKVLVPPPSRNRNDLLTIQAAEVPYSESWTAPPMPAPVAVPDRSNPADDWAPVTLAATTLAPGPHPSRPTQPAVAARKPPVV